MERRDFLRRGIGKVTEKAVQQAEAKITGRVNWIRPPFAQPEMEFLLTCTRCSACLEACPHGVIFPLANRLGPAVAGSPALDLLNKACHLCTDWPCVKQCEPNALQLPEHPVDTPWPKLAKASINEDVCLPYLGPECGACRDHCPVSGAMTWENERPTINAAYCTGCAMCREACVVDPKAVDIEIL